MNLTRWEQIESPSGWFLPDHIGVVRMSSFLHWNKVDILDHKFPQTVFIISHLLSLFGILSSIHFNIFEFQVALEFQSYWRLLTFHRDGRSYVSGAHHLLAGVSGLFVLSHDTVICKVHVQGWCNRVPQNTKKTKSLITFYSGSGLCCALFRASHRV